MEVFPGCSMVADHMELFWHPLRGDRWAAIATGTDFIVQPMPMIGTRDGHPATSRRGLAIATLGLQGPAAFPKVLSLAEPLLVMSKVLTYILGMPVDCLPVVLGKFRDLAGDAGSTAPSYEAEPRLLGGLVDAYILAC
jgi:hypothetical protein